MLKTTNTPAEFANVVQGLTFPVTLNSGRVAAPSAASVIGSMIADGPFAIRNLRARLGTGGTGAGPTLVHVKKNGDSVASVSIAHDDDDGTSKVGLPTSDELAKVEAGDLITIEVETVSTAAAGLDVTVHLDRRFA